MTRTIVDTYEFDYRGTTYPLDLNHFPAMEACWLEDASRKSLAFLTASFAAGGMYGTIAYLMLALRRAGQHSLAKWDRLMTMNIMDPNEFMMRRIAPDEPATETDDDINEGVEEGGQAADPTAPSCSTPTGSDTDTPTDAPSSGSAKKSRRTSRTSSTASGARPGTSANA